MEEERRKIYMVVGLNLVVYWGSHHQWIVKEPYPHPPPSTVKWLCLLSLTKHSKQTTSQLRCRQQQLCVSLVHCPSGAPRQSRPGHPSHAGPSTSPGWSPSPHQSPRPSITAPPPRESLSPRLQTPFSSSRII